MELSDNYGVSVDLGEIEGEPSAQLPKVRFSVLEKAKKWWLVEKSGKKSEKIPEKKLQNIWNSSPTSLKIASAMASMAGQTINDRLLAARHSLAGQGLAKSVCKATTEEMIGPKKKHLDCKYPHLPFT